MKSRKLKKDVIIYIFVILILTILNYQATGFKPIWVIYPAIIWGGILLINRWFK